MPHVGFEGSFVESRFFRHILRSPRCGKQDYGRQRGKERSGHAASIVELFCGSNRRTQHPVGLVQLPVWAAAPRSKNPELPVVSWRNLSIRMRKKSLLFLG